MAKVLRTRGVSKLFPWSKPIETPHLSPDDKIWIADQLDKGEMTTLDFKESRLDRFLRWVEHRQGVILERELERHRSSTRW